MFYWQEHIVRLNSLLYIKMNFIIWNLQLLSSSCEKIKVTFCESDVKSVVLL